MKFEKTVVDILNNFSTINQSIVFKPGNVISTVSPTKTIIAKANVDVEFESEFGVYNLPQLLSVVTLFDEPEITVNSKTMTIGSGSETIKYVLSEPRLIQQPPENAIKLPSEDVVFDLTADVLKKAMKVLNVIGAPSLAFTGEDGKLYVEAIDPKNSSTNSYRVNIGDTDNEFRAIFSADNLKLIPQDYEVTLCSKGISYFKNPLVSYFVAVEKESNFN